LTFYPPKKVTLACIRVEKNFFEIRCTGYQKKWNFALIAKMCRSLEFGKREKKISEKLIFTGLCKFCKKRFSEKISLGTSLHKSSTHFRNQRKIPLLLIPFAPYFKESFFQLL
jgi:hypothetical protein